MLFLLLINELEDRERECAERIYLDYGERIYMIALRITKNKHDAEDVLDSVMINIMRNIERFISAEREDIEAQITIYTRNEAINAYRRKKRRIEKEVPYTDCDEDVLGGSGDVGPDAERIVITEETVQTVRKYLALLPAEYEEALRLVYRYGYSQTEAAKILHITENNLRIRIYRAKQKLLSISGEELYERTRE